MTDKIVVFTTCGLAEEAERVARGLVEKRVAACVNVVSGVRSIYQWQGKVEEASEHLLIIKSRRDLFDRLQEALRGLHSYQVPEIVALPVVDGLEAYLGWMDRELEAQQ